MNSKAAQAYKILGILQAHGFSKEEAELVTDAVTAVETPELASKADLKEFELRIVKWSVGIQIAQTGVTAAVVVGLLQVYLG